MIVERGYDMKEKTMKRIILRDEITGRLSETMFCDEKDIDEAAEYIAFDFAANLVREENVGDFLKYPEGVPYGVLKKYVIERVKYFEIYVADYDDYDIYDLDEPVTDCSELDLTIPKDITSSVEPIYIDEEKPVNPSYGYWVYVKNVKTSELFKVNEIMPSKISASQRSERAIEKAARKITYNRWIKEGLLPLEISEGKKSIFEREPSLKDKYLREIEEEKKNWIVVE